MTARFFLANQLFFSFAAKIGVTEEVIDAVRGAR